MAVSVVQSVPRSMMNASVVDQEVQRLANTSRGYSFAVRASNYKIYQLVTRYFCSAAVVSGGCLALSLITLITYTSYSNFGMFIYLRYCDIQCLRKLLPGMQCFIIIFIIIRHSVRRFKAMMCTISQKNRL